MKSLFILSIFALGLLLVGIDEATASSLTASLALFFVPAGPVLQVKQGCKFIDGERVCGKKKSHGGDDDGDNNNNNKNNNNAHHNNNDNNNSGNANNNNPGKNKQEKTTETAVKPNCAPGTVLSGEQCHCPAGTVPKNGINNVQSVSECQAPATVHSFLCTAGVNPNPPGRLNATIAAKTQSEAEGKFAQLIKDANLEAWTSVACLDRGTQ